MTFGCKPCRHGCGLERPLGWGPVLHRRHIRHLHNIPLVSLQNVFFVCIDCILLLQTCLQGRDNACASTCTVDAMLTSGRHKGQLHEPWHTIIPKTASVTTLSYSRISIQETVDVLPIPLCTQDANWPPPSAVATPGHAGTSQKPSPGHTIIPKTA
jgi:hypothetical protein